MPVMMSVVDSAKKIGTHRSQRHRLITSLHRNFDHHNQTTTKDSAPQLTDLIEVEGISPRNGAIESALQEGRPGVLQALRAASPVALAHARDPRVHALPAVHVFDGGFAEEEEHEVAVVEGVHEVRSCEGKVVVTLFVD